MNSPTLTCRFDLPRAALAPRATLLATGLLLAVLRAGADDTPSAPRDPSLQILLKEQLGLYRAPAAAPSFVAPAASRTVAYASLPFDTERVAAMPPPPAIRPVVARGRLQVRGDLARFVTSEGPALSISGQALPASPAFSALNLAVTTEREPDGTVAIKQLRAELLDRYSRALDHLANPAARGKLTASLESLSQKVGQAATTSGRQAAQLLADGVAQSQRECVDSFLLLSPDEQRERTPQLGGFYLEAQATRRRLHDKSIFGDNDQYAPGTYRDIYERCLPVARLVYNRRTIGTAFLLGQNIVLTAGHCLADQAGEPLDPRNFRVVFEKPGAPPATLEYPIANVLIRGGRATVDGVSVAKLDFVILQLDANTASHHTAMEDGLRPLAVASRLPPVQRNSVLYVVGFPGGYDKMVADYAHVFVPFENTLKAHTGYRLELEGEIARMQESAEQEPDPARRELQRQLAAYSARDLRQRFAASFQKVGEGENTRFMFVSALLAHGDRFPPQPAIALDSDTFHGDSGAPVFARGSSEVVGLFTRGAPDTDGLRIGWEDHEEAIPIHFILIAWETEQPGAPARYAVTVRSTPPSTAFAIHNFSP